MASSSGTSRRRVSFNQLEALWEFLNTHKDIALGRNKTAQAREYSQRMWQTVAEILNSLGEGAVKTWRNWSKYWVDYKAKLKRRASNLRSSQQRTGGGPSTEPPLTDIERKFLQLVGEDLGVSLPGVRVEPFVEETPQECIEPVVEEQHEEEYNIEDSPILIIVQPENSPEPEPAIASPHESYDDNSVAVTERNDNLPTVDGAAAVGRQGAALVRRTRTRQRRAPQITASAAREKLIESSRLRAEAEITNSRSIQVAIEALHGIMDILKKIEEKMPHLPVEAATNDL